MPEVLYVQRGKKKYAYTSTTVYEPGSEYPKTVNECLGVLDGVTGKIIPKKNRMSADKILDDATPTGRRFGGSYVLLDVAERIELREDLFRSYGPAGDRILACAVAQALSGGAVPVCRGYGGRMSDKGAPGHRRQFRLAEDERADPRPGSILRKSGRTVRNAFEKNG